MSEQPKIRSRETIATPEDLDTLPLGAIVKIGPRPDNIIVRYMIGGQLGDWEHAGDERPSDIEEIRRYWLDAFPAEVLYRPKDAGAGRLDG